jgi:DNA-binding IclR family transcriptional regulator
VGQRRSLSSVSNALAVVDYLADVGEAGVSDISRQIDVTVGTAHRLVTTLVAAGYAEQNRDNRRYRLSVRLATIGRKVRLTLNASEIAHRCLIELVGRVHETGNLAVLSDGEVLYVDKALSDQPFAIDARVGSRLPTYCIALGKVLVASLDDDEFAGQIERVRSSGKSGVVPTPPKVEDFIAEIERAKTDGYALDLGGYLPDVCCVAAPVRGADGTVVAAMSVSVPRSRFRGKRGYLIKETQTVAAALSEEFREVGIPEHARELIPAGLIR